MATAARLGMVRCRLARIGGGAIAATLLGGLSADVASAQVANPTADGTMPGAVLIAKVLGWLKWAGLASALAALLIGAITTGVGHFGSNYGASSAGRKWLLGGMGAAVLAGLAWTIATTLYTATGGA